MSWLELTIYTEMEKKTPKDVVPRGRKNKKATVELDKKLRELYDEDGITPWRASIIAKCGYKYAIAKFTEFGTDAMEAEKEDWLDRNERVRQRALEGLSLKIKKQSGVLKRLEDQLSHAKELHDGILQKTGEKLLETNLGQAVSHLDQKDVMILAKILVNDLNLEKNYGYYVTTIEDKIKMEEVFVSELVQQFDAIEILPPPKTILEAELERRIAEKQNLKPAIPNLQAIS